MNEDVQIVNIQQLLAIEEESLHDKNLVKACLFNLIVYSPDTKRTEYLKTIINIITERFPCRIIFIQSDQESAHPYLHVKADQEFIGKGESIIAIDRITIETSANYHHRVPFLVIPNIVADLPVFLLWGQDPAKESSMLPQLQNIATKLIFDSECSENLQRFCRKIIDQIKNQKINFMDMNWAYISGWRDVLFQVFNSPEKLKDLKNAKTVRIIYNKIKSLSLQHCEIQTIYLQGWLAAQMGWAFASKNVDEEGTHLIYTNGKKTIEIDLCPQELEYLEPGMISEINIESYENQIFNLKRQHDLSKVSIHVSYLETCELPYTLTIQNLRRGSSFMKEVFYRAISDHYFNMLQTIEPIDWQH